MVSASWDVLQAHKACSVQPVQQLPPILQTTIRTVLHTHLRQQRNSHTALMARQTLLIVRLQHATCCTAMHDMMEQGATVHLINPK